MKTITDGHDTAPKPEGISAWFIRRPVASILAAIAITLLGIAAIPNLPVAPLPEADFPTLQVTATLPGASPETMASSVATVLETAFTGIPGVTEMTSASSLGQTSITLQFELERNIDIAAQEVQAAINSVTSRLPDNMPSLPTWRKVNPTDGPVMVLTVRSSTLPTTELSDIVETRLARRLSQIDGVAQVQVGGLQRPAIRIQAQPERLAAYGLTMEDIRTAITAANVNRPKGAIYGGSSIATLETNDQLFSDSEYREVVVATRDGAPIRVGDVARVQLGPEDAYLAAWPDGVPGLGIFVDRQPGANIISIADAIRERLPTLMADLPADIDVTIMNDRTRTIRASLHEVEITLVLTFVLVVLVMGLFLRQVAPTLIVGIVLGISVVATFGAIYLLGFSLNNLTLVALIIAIGFVVDDAIVVVENIHRHMENGENKLSAAFKGSKEIGFTVISITFSLIAAFIPLLFMGGIVGRLFREFSVTVTVALLISVVMSLTLAPMLCAKFMKAPKHRSGVGGASSPGGLTSLYAAGLRWTLRHKAFTMLVFVATISATVAAYVYIPKGFFPAQDTGFIAGARVPPKTFPSKTCETSIVRSWRSFEQIPPFAPSTRPLAGPAAMPRWEQAGFGSPLKTAASETSRSTNSSRACAPSSPQSPVLPFNFAPRRTSISGWRARPNIRTC